MKTIFPGLFKTRLKYRIILKSGADFFVSATDLNIKYNTGTMQLTDYNFIKPDGEIPFHVSPLEIAAILQLK